MNAPIEETIERVEQLYTTLTGKRPETGGPHVPIPPEADPVVHVQEQLARLLSVAERVVPTSASPSWMPRAVTWLHGTELVLAIDAPGVLARDLRIRVEPLAIVVTGQRRVPWPQPPSRIAECDAPLGAFARAFALGSRISPDQVSARLEDGVLAIRIAGGPRSEPSQIPITS